MLRRRHVLSLVALLAILHARRGDSAAGAPVISPAPGQVGSSGTTATPAAGAPDSTTADTRADSENAFPVVLGSFSTTMVGSAPTRTHNIRLSVQALDGIVLQPGDVLSFNRTVGPRTAERGYGDAPVILRESRQLQRGGGICQAASTLFDAALLSGLSVVERHRHSQPIDYVALGQDATISWGVKDLKLRNDLDQRVRLRIEVLGSTLTARFEGESPTPETFELISDVRETADADAGAPGHEIELYRVRKVDGEERDRELVHRDVYPIARVRELEAMR
jgi:vancomycin resistance protein YoaR